MFFRSRLNEVELPELGVTLRLTGFLSCLEIYRLSEGAEKSVQIGRLGWQDDQDREHRFPLEDHRTLIVQVDKNPSESVDEGAGYWIWSEGQEVRTRVFRRVKPRAHSYLPAFHIGLLALFGSAAIGQELWEKSFWLFGWGFVMCAVVWLPWGRFHTVVFGTTSLLGWLVGCFWVPAILPAAGAVMVGLDTPSFHFAGLFLYGMMLRLMYLLGEVLEKVPDPNRGAPRPEDAWSLLLLHFLDPGRRDGLRCLPLPDSEHALQWLPGFRELTMVSARGEIPIRGLNRHASVPVGLGDGTHLDIGPLDGRPVPTAFKVATHDGEALRAVDGAAERLSQAFVSWLMGLAWLGFAWGLWSTSHDSLPFWGQRLPLSWLAAVALCTAVIVFLCVGLVVKGIHPRLSQGVGDWVALLAMGPCFGLPWASWIGVFILEDHESLQLFHRAFGLGMLLLLLIWLGFWARGLVQLVADKETFQITSLEPRWKPVEEDTAPDVPQDSGC